MNDGPIKMMGGPFDVFGLFEGAGITVESYFSSKGQSTSGKVISIPFPKFRPQVK